QVAAGTGESAIKIGKRTFGARIYEKAVGEGGKFIAHGAIHRPLRRQPLPGLKDFFHYHVKRRPLGGPLMAAENLLKFFFQAVWRERRLGHWSGAMRGAKQHLQAGEVLP